MKESINVGIKGEVLVKANGKKVYVNKNNIEPNADKILMRCLTQLDFPKSVDTIKVGGTFGEEESLITFAQFLTSENCILFKASFNNTAFRGTINTLKLCNSALNLNLATKGGLNIVKDSDIVIQIEWKIFITVN